MVPIHRYKDSSVRETFKNSQVKMEITNSMKIVLKTKKPEWLKAKTDLKLLDSVFSVCRCWCAAR